MARWSSRSLLAGACILVAHSMVTAQEAAPAAPAAEPAPAVGDKIGITIGYDYASHFVSYGADVWGGGNDFFSDESTNFVWADVAVDLSPFTLNFGVWSDNNNNVDSPLGGPIQEIDVYAGISYSIDRFTLGAKYQEWFYGGDEERIVDLSVAFDDSDLLFDGFALNPSFLAHFRIDGNGAQEEAEAFVVGIAPSFQLTEGDYALTLTIPVNVAFFTDDFQGGDSGYGYSSVGATLGVPLAFIPVEYGEWNAALNVTYYMTDEDAIPNNPEDDFLTGTVSISTSF
jgi:hypothetical protein